MNKSAQAKVIASVSIDIDDCEARIEKLSPGEAGQATIRISAWKKGKRQAELPALSEAQLIELLHKATHAGVVSYGIIGKLREKIEI